MTGMVASTGRFSRLAGWLAMGVGLALTGQARAEPLVSRFRHDSKTKGAADFAVAADRPAAAVVHHAPRRRARPSPLQELRKALLREHGAETITLFFGYYGAFISPPPVTQPPPGQLGDVTPPLPPTQLSDGGSPPPFQMPPPPPVKMPTSLQPYMPPLQSGSPTQAPEPTTLLLGLVGGGLTGLVSWRKRRRKSAPLAD